MFKKVKHIYTIIIWVLCFSVTGLSGVPVSEAFNPLQKANDILKKVERVFPGSSLPRWYKDYLNAKYAAKHEKWEKAIGLFEKAIEQEPKAQKWEMKNGRIGDYYPYLYLGMAYLAVGDRDAAQQYCKRSQEKGIAPEADIEACLAAGFQETELIQVPEELAPPSSSEDPLLQAKTLSTRTSETSQVSSERGLVLSGTASRGQDVFVPQVLLPETLRNMYAVIIGIGRFEDKRIPFLNFARNDAQEMYNLLTDLNYSSIPRENIKLLLNEKATRQNIKSAIGKWLSRQAREEDTVIIYYAGHSAPEEDGMYWVTYDADIEDLYSTALDNNNIADMLDRVESKRLITFLDTCYSAATTNRSNRTRQLNVEIPWDRFLGEGRVMMSASNGKELSLELTKYGHGVFTYYLLQGLQGEADGMAGKERDGIVEVEELWSYVSTHVSKAAKKSGNSQTPVFQGVISAGVLLTYNKPFLEERKRLEALNYQEHKLQQLFEQGMIETAHFDCAFQMLRQGRSDPYIDGLLNGKLSPSTFNQSFDCPL